jgi:Arc/MetJ family transcription regulator
MNLDFALVSEAAAVLGTEQTTETVHTAMRDVVARARRRRLAARDLPDLTPEAVEEMRQPRLRP